MGRLIQKIGAEAIPFTFKFPENTSPSVIIQPGDNDKRKRLGVEYCLKTYVGEKSEDKSHKKSNVLLAMKKLHFHPANRTFSLPSSIVSKKFVLSSGKLILMVNLDKDIFYHGEDIKANITVRNKSQKTVKNVKIMVVQHCQLIMINTLLSRNVAELETCEGCPITPRTTLTKSFNIKPLASSIKNRNGIVFDGYFKDQDVNLASSTLIAEGMTPSDSMGFIISYSLRVKLNCGTLGRDLQTDVPFKLLNE